MEAPVHEPGVVVKPLPLLRRVPGVLFSPRETFASVVAYPRWLGVLALVLLGIAALNAGFLSTAVGRQAFIDQQVASRESFGATVSDQAYQQIASFARFAPAVVAGSILVFAPLFGLLISGILLGVFNAVLGGDASLKQVFAIQAHAGVVSLVQALFTVPLNYARASMSSATSLGAFFPFLQEGSFLANLLGSIDLFIVWNIVVLAIGLSVLYRRRTPPIVGGLLAAYAVVAVVIAAVKAALGGS